MTRREATSGTSRSARTYLCESCVFFPFRFGSTAKKPSLKMFDGAFRGKIAPIPPSVLLFELF